MMVIFLGFLGSVVAVIGLHLTVPMQASPIDQVTLPSLMPGAAAIGEKVQLEPLSEFKFKNIAKQVYDYSCGSASLVNLLNGHIGLAVTEQQVMEGMLKYGEPEKIMERRGFSLLDMKRFVATLGLEANGFRGELSDLRRLTTPVIVPIDSNNFKHFVVLRGMRDGKVFMADPALGHTVMSESEFAQAWDRNTLFQINPAKGQKPVDRLAMTNEELGVIDADMIRSDVIFRTLHTNDALQRAIQFQQGIATWR